MDNQQNKLMFRLSIGLNVLLIVLVLWGHLRMNFLNDQLLLLDVRNNMVELEGQIAKQSLEHWPEPNVVATEMGEVVKGLWRGLSKGETLTQEEEIILHALYFKLKQYPYDNKFNSSELTEEDKENFEELQVILRDVRLGLDTQVADHEKPFINQAAELEKRIVVPSFQDKN